MAANTIEYGESQGINSCALISQQIVNDFSARSQATYTTGKKSQQLQALENEIEKRAVEGVYDYKIDK